MKFKIILTGIIEMVLFLTMNNRTNINADTLHATELSSSSLILLNSEEVNYPDVNLNGQTQITSADAIIQVVDNTNSNAGWSVTLSARVFMADDKSGHSLPSNALLFNSPYKQTCNGSSCTLSSINILPTTIIPLNSTSGNPVKILEEEGNLPNILITSFLKTSLSVPANAYEGSYISTWIVSLTTGP